MSPGRNRRLNDYLLLSAIAAALQKEGDRRCEKHLKTVSQIDAFCFPKLHNVRICILSPPKRADKVHAVYSKFEMTVSIYCVNILFKTEIEAYTTDGQMSLFTHLSLWNSSNASSHAAPEK